MAGVTDSEPFRVLSIGCGNGLADWSMLKIITESLSDIEIHHLGMDIDEKSGTDPGI